jgi:hypothetical protein
MDKKRVVVEALIEHFNRTWDMWVEAIGNTTEEGWRMGDVSYLIPARQLVHTLTTADFYIGDLGAGDYDFNRMFNGDWESMTEWELPEKDFALRKLEEVRKLVSEALSELDDEALMAKEEIFPYTGKTLLHRYIYLLRHTQHHLGELNGELTRRAVGGADWR